MRLLPGAVVRFPTHCEPRVQRRGGAERAHGGVDRRNVSGVVPISFYFVFLSCLEAGPSGQTIEIYVRERCDKLPANRKLWTKGGGC